MKQVGCQQADEQPAARAAQSYGDIKTGEVARVRLEAHQFAVAHHAADKQGRAARRDGDAHLHGAVVGPQPVSFTAEQAELLESALTDAGVGHTLEFYAARHGFAVPDNPTYDTEADARHWEALRELYRTHLQGS